MNNSSLVDYTLLSPNNSGKRTHTIDRITPHCFVGQVTAKRGAEVFLPTSKQASCQYVIGLDGRVSLVCDEDNRSWCSSSEANDQRAITIECASDNTEPYAFNDAVYNKLVALCVDVCQRYKKTKLLWISDKEKALAYEPKADEMLLTVHRWFANKSCPGDWLYSRLGDLATRVTAKLSDKKSDNGVLYRVQIGAFSVKANADAMLAKVKSAGFDAFITTEAGQPAPEPQPQPQLKSIDEVAREVIQGKWGNGAERKRRLAEAGYNYSEVQARVNALLTN